MNQPVLEFDIFRRIIRAKIHFPFVCFGWNVLTDVQFEAFPGILFIKSLINSFETWKTTFHSNGYAVCQCDVSDFCDVIFISSLCRTLVNSGSYRFHSFSSTWSVHSDIVLRLAILL